MRFLFSAAPPEKNPDSLFYKSLFPDIIKDVEVCFSKYVLNMRAPMKRLDRKTLTIKPL